MNTVIRTNFNSFKPSIFSILVQYLLIRAVSWKHVHVVSLVVGFSHLFLFRTCGYFQVHATLLLKHVLQVYFIMWCCSSKLIPNKVHFYLYINGISVVTASPTSAHQRHPDDLNVENDGPCLRGT